MTGPSGGPDPNVSLLIRQIGDLSAELDAIDATVARCPTPVRVRIAQPIRVVRDVVVLLEDDAIRHSGPQPPTPPSVEKTRTGDQDASRRRHEMFDRFSSAVDRVAREVPRPPRR